MMSSAQPKSMTECVADFVTGFARGETRSESDALEILTISLADWCAVGLAGVDEPVSTIVRDLALADGGRAHSSIFGASLKLPAKAAAMVNGATSHALDYDDTHFMHVGHTSVAVFSAALAVAESQKRTGVAFMDAALIGSEVCCHVGHWLGRSHYQAGFHQTATSGTFGATAAACRLLNLDHLQTRHALGFAATRASGLTSQFGTMSKPYHAGMAASNGVEAALLAANGFTARLDGIECSRGFADTHHVDREQPVASDTMLGHDYVFTAVQHKLHACCHGLHASIEALTELKDAHLLGAGDIDSISIQTNPRWLDVCNVAEPSTALESKFSYRHTSSLVFSHYDTAALATFTDANCHDPSLQRVRELTRVVGDDTLGDTASRVSVQAKDGRVFQAFCDLAETLPTQVRQDRVLAKCRAMIGAGVTENLWMLVQQLATLKERPVDSLCALIRCERQ